MTWTVLALIFFTVVVVGVQLAAGPAETPGCFRSPASKDRCSDASRSHGCRKPGRPRRVRNTAAHISRREAARARLDGPPPPPHRSATGELNKLAGQ
jgi:hypothetical protein